jgi:sugar lactone lactonase YvrE
MFAPGDPTTLYVLSYGGGRLFQLTLDASHHETGRMMVAMGLGNPDGITLDSTGRFYVTDNGGGRVLRLDADGTGLSMLMGGLSAPANLELGSGALDCHDLYVATGDVLVRIDTMTATSAAVAWH